MTCSLLNKLPKLPVYRHTNTVSTLQNKQTLTPIGSASTIQHIPALSLGLLHSHSSFIPFFFLINAQIRPARRHQQPIPSVLQGQIPRLLEELPAHPSGSSVDRSGGGTTSRGVGLGAHALQQFPVEEVVVGEALAEEQFSEEFLQVVVVGTIVEAKALHVLKVLPELS